MIIYRLKIVVIGILTCSLCHQAFADPGVFKDRILFGQSAVMKGPASALGIGMNTGILAAFNAQNAQGGIDGRKLDLLTYNDGYEPELAAANTKKLIVKDKVFALIGAVGTPTSRVSVPIANEYDVPFIGPFTGAGFLRKSENRNVINIRASYEQEAETWIKHLTEDLGLTRIAVFYQDDSFGQAGLKGVRKALASRNMRMVARGNYARNLTAVHSALFTIRKAEPEAVVMVGAYRPNAAFIRLARTFELDALFINISFVGAKALAKELGTAGKEVVISQVVPFPWDTDIKLVSEYHKALSAYNKDSEPGFVSLEGYIVGRLIIESLKRLKAEPTRKKLLNTIYTTGPFELGGIDLSFAEGDNQGMDNIYLTVIQEDGSFQSVNHLLPLTKKPAVNNEYETISIE